MKIFLFLVFAVFANSVFGMTVLSGYYQGAQMEDNGVLSLEVREECTVYITVYEKKTSRFLSKMEHTEKDEDGKIVLKKIRIGGFYNLNREDFFMVVEVVDGYGFPVGTSYVTLPRKD